MASSAKEKKVSKKRPLPKEVLGFEYQIIQEPHVTEKGTQAAQAKTYVFRVKKTASKRQIKAALERIFGVNIVFVHTVMMKGKTKRRGLYSGKTVAWKKAYVKVSKDDTIELF